MTRLGGWVLGIGLAVAAPAPLQASPVTVENCGRALVFDHAPRRAVVQDINMSEMLFALQAQPNIAGIVGVTGWYKPTPAFVAAQGGIPELAAKTASLETLLAAHADFYFGGWYYGMTPGGALTPERLAAAGIQTYVLTESCAHLGAPPSKAGMALLYDDELALGRIFGRSTLADALVAGWEARVGRVAEAVRGRPKPRVFVYDSGEDKPFTAGRFAMPTAIIDAAGGQNVMEDRPMSWGTTSWEDVATRDPQFLVLLDYQTGAGYRKLLDFLAAHPAMSQTEAVRNRRFIALRYEQLTPGPDNIDAVEALGRALHPDAFATADGAGAAK